MTFFLTQKALRTESDTQKIESLLKQDKENEYEF